MPTEIKIPQTSEYKNWIKELKQKLRKSQIKAAINVNSVLLEGTSKNTLLISQKHI